MATPLSLCTLSYASLPLIGIHTHSFDLVQSPELMVCLWRIGGSFFQPHHVYHQFSSISSRQFSQFNSYSQHNCFISSFICVSGLTCGSDKPSKTCHKLTLLIRLSYIYSYLVA